MSTDLTTVRALTFDVFGPRRVAPIKKNRNGADRSTATTEANQ